MLSRRLNFSKTAAAHKQDCDDCIADIECVGSVTNIGVESGTGDPGSNSVLTCCIHFRPNTIGNGINLSLRQHQNGGWVILAVTWTLYC